MIAYRWRVHDRLRHAQAEIFFRHAPTLAVLHDALDRHAISSGLEGRQAFRMRYAPALGRYGSQPEPGRTGPGQESVEFTLEPFELL